MTVNKTVEYIAQQNTYQFHVLNTELKLFKAVLDDSGNYELIVSSPVFLNKSISFQIVVDGSTVTSPVTTSTPQFVSNVPIVAIVAPVTIVVIIIVAGVIVIVLKKRRKTSICFFALFFSY